VNKEQSVRKMTMMMASFIGYLSKKLPDDVEVKLTELGAKETSPLPIRS
jgi:L(+)-tartrate dehydratase alpha subunit